MGYSQKTLSDYQSGIYGVSDIKKSFNPSTIPYYPAGPHGSDSAPDLTIGSPSPDTAFKKSITPLSRETDAVIPAVEYKGSWYGKFRIDGFGADDSLNEIAFIELEPPRSSTATEHINYTWNGHTVGTNSFTGNGGRSFNGLNNYPGAKHGIPAGWHLANNADATSKFIKFDGKPFDIAVNPNQASATVKYNLGNGTSGKVVGSYTFHGPSATAQNSVPGVNIGATFQIGNAPKGMLSGFHLKYPGNSTMNIPYDNGVHYINVVPSTKSVTYKGQHGRRVGSQTVKDDFSNEIIPKGYHIAK